MPGYIVRKALTGGRGRQLDLLSLAKRDRSTDRLDTPPPQPTPQLLGVGVHVYTADLVTGARVRHPQPRQQPKIPGVLAAYARGSRVVPPELIPGHHSSFARDDRV